ncbi:hypothetical protein HZH66_013758 [Vespula vulgaris]|uniref:Uncharacterized protein n=1 Tax=Vespula vulgaris TaxID=7454 RepID=A0A834MRV1_VESVU|nr:hypothetical protein HZH66_013758 [Vespula vulgaris]
MVGWRDVHPVSGPALSPGNSSSNGKTWNGRSWIEGKLLSPFPLPPSTYVVSTRRWKHFVAEKEEEGGRGSCSEEADERTLFRNKCDITSVLYESVLPRDPPKISRGKRYRLRRLPRRASSFGPVHPVAVPKWQTATTGIPLGKLPDQRYSA